MKCSASSALVVLSEVGIDVDKPTDLRWYVKSWKTGEGVVLRRRTLAAMAKCCQTDVLRTPSGRVC